jgi:hypothetical protein
MTISRPDDFPAVQTYTDESGRQFHYIHISRPHTRKLLIHFTAFFGDWGERKQYRYYYQGYFHRFRMFRNESDYGCLFLCDQFGADSNGTYYTGQKGDFFVERAMRYIIATVMAKDLVPASNVVTIGSSMGATGAMKFGLMLKTTKGIVSISPHIDLDTCAQFQNRMRHVSFIVPDGDPLSISNRVYTRQISNTVSAWDQSQGPLPRLVIIGCVDDHGAYKEQIVPLAEMWRQKGGQLDLYIRPIGGHTSEYATEAVLHDIVSKLFEDAEIDPVRYVNERKFWPETEETPSANIVAHAVDETSDAALEPQVIKFDRNPDLVAAAADYMIATARGAQLDLAVAFFPQIDEALKDELLRRSNEGDLNFQTLSSRPIDDTTPQKVRPPFAHGSWRRFVQMLQHRMSGSTLAADVNSPPNSLILELTGEDGTTVPINQRTSGLAVIMNSAFYAWPRDKSRELLAAIPKRVEFLLILDQIDNYDARESEVRTLSDNLGRSYEAQCHDFRNLLEAAGFFKSFVMPLPYPAKSITGVIIASRSVDVGLDDFYRHLRAAKKIVASHKRATEWQRFDPRKATEKMVGQFIIPSGAPAGLRIKAYIRNTARDSEPFPIEVRQQGLAVDLRVFAKGKLIYRNPRFARVPFDGVQEISETTCPALAGAQSDLLVIAECSLPSVGPTYFSQEHQLGFENPSTRISGSVLYDHLPLVTAKKFSPIVLLAPKVWVGSHFKSFVAFASSNSSTNSATQREPLVVTILDEQGRQISSERFEPMENSAFLFDVKRALTGKVDLGPVPQFFNVVAKGGASSFVIVTFVINEETGNFALEHSLSPHYYAAEGLQRVRKEALRFHST